MANYSRYKTDTIQKMRDKAYEKYCYETTRTSSADNWENGMRLAKLPHERAWEKAKERYESLEKELADRRKREASI